MRTTAGAAPWLIPVGGYLGAGKTTLILAAARLLERQGLRTAVILNDQGQDLVDTRLAAESGLAAGEVTGGCFCCNFFDLIDAIKAVRQTDPAAIFIEPVGSCTDLSATILQPLKRDYPDWLRLAPLTVAVDPVQAADLLGGGADPDAAFLFRHQLAEADLACFTKADLGLPEPELPGARVRSLSARSGEGVAQWLEEVLSGAVACGGRVLEIDYQRHARAEAALAWLDWQATVVLRPALSPSMLIGPLMDALDAALSAAGVRMAHLKVLDQAASGFLKAAVTRNGAEPEVEGALDASPAARHQVLINLRALGTPEQVRAAVEPVLARLPGKREAERMQCFQPGEPKPQHRIAEPVR